MLWVSVIGRNGAENRWMCNTQPPNHTLVRHVLFSHCNCLGIWKVAHNYIHHTHTRTFGIRRRTRLSNHHLFHLLLCLSNRDSLRLSNAFISDSNLNSNNPSFDTESLMKCDAFVFISMIWNPFVYTSHHMAIITNYKFTSNIVSANVIMGNNIHTLTHIYIYSEKQTYIYIYL